MHKPDPGRENGYNITKGVANVDNVYAFLDALLQLLRFARAASA